MFFIGIDVAKRSHQAAVTDISGNVIVKPFNFKNSSDGFTKFLSIVESNAMLFSRPFTADDTYYNFAFIAPLLRIKIAGTSPDNCIQKGSRTFYPASFSFSI